MRPTSRSNNVIDNPTRTQSTFMMILGFVSLWMITLHFDDLKKIEDYKKKSTNIRIPAFMLLNIWTVFGGASGFGRPIAPVIVTVIGLVVLIVIGYNLPGLIEWIDKLFYIITSLSIAFEYFLYVIQNYLRCALGFSLLDLLSYRILQSDLQPF